MKRFMLAAAGTTVLLLLLDSSLFAATKPAIPPSAGAPAAPAQTGASEDQTPHTVESGEIHTHADPAPPPEVQKEIDRAHAAELRAHELREAARTHPTEVRYQIDLLSGFLDLDLTDEAVAVGPDLVEAFPKSSELFLLYARALVRDGSSSLARLQFQRSMALDGTSAAAHMGAARIDLMQGDLKSAEMGLRKALSLEPARTDTRTLLADLLERTGRYADAVDILSAPSKKDGPKVALTGRQTLLPEFVKEPPLVLPAGFSGITVPFKTLSAFPPLVGMKIGDGPEKLFVVDTGSEDLILTSDTAKELGLPDKGKTTIKDEQGREYPTPAYLVLDHVVLGGVTIKRVPARVAPGVRYPRRQIAGALGREFLRKFRIVIDYPAKTLTLGRSDGRPLDGVPFELAGAILVEGSNGDRQLGKFVVDTSSYTPGAMDNKFVAAETGLTLFSPDIKPIAEGPHLFKFTMPHLSVGGMDFTKFPATAVDLRLMSKQLHVNVHGIIGHSLLSDCRLEIDFKNQKLSLKKSAAPAQARATGA